MLGEEAPQLALAPWFGEGDGDLVHLVRGSPRCHHCAGPEVKGEARTDRRGCTGPLRTREPFWRWIDVRTRQLEAVEQAEEKLAEPRQRQRVVRPTGFVVPTLREGLERLHLRLDGCRATRARLLITLFGKTHVA